MPTFILSGGRMEIKSDSPFPCLGCHIANKKVPGETSSRQVMNFNTTQMLHVCMYGGYSIMWASRGFEVGSHM